jgi:hypothetical protein
MEEMAETAAMGTDSDELPLEEEEEEEIPDELAS